MERVVSSQDLKQALGKILDDVSSKGGRFLIQRRGKTVAVLVPPADYERLQGYRQKLFALVDQIHERNKDVSPETLDAEIAEAIGATRASQDHSTAS
ncbi:MAG: type II toxin-antitoxin system Phd/YefM family antitoxin [Chloroflexi bacterium]|nr:type II toxin-antitoxin system Phd/YefM family antitoxin [Chloroflexota bacterium]